jgi:hypothetical protein
VVWGLSPRPIPWATPQAVFFRDRVSRTICPGLALNRDLPDFCLLSS